MNSTNSKDIVILYPLIGLLARQVARELWVPANDNRVPGHAPVADKHDQASVAPKSVG